MKITKLIAKYFSLISLIVICSLTLGACGSGDNSETRLETDVLSGPPVAILNNVTTLNGARNAYMIRRSQSGFFLKDSDDSGVVTNLQENQSTLKFKDFTVSLLAGEISKSISQEELNSLIELYIAFFNRVPDAEGMIYWIGEIKAGRSIEQLADNFYTAAIDASEVTGYAENMTTEEFVRKIYKNVLGRNEVDQGGLNYWSVELNAGRKSRGNLIRTIIDAAHGFKNNSNYGWVADLLDNKVTIGTYFSIQQGLNYPTPNESIAKGMEIVALVTSSDIAAAKNKIGIIDSALDLRNINESSVSPEFTTLEFEAQKAGRVAAADFNGDGLVDIAAMSNGGSGLVEPQSYIYSQRSDGSFLRSSLESGFFYPMIAGDVNNDGKADLIIGSSCQLIVKLGSTNLQFTSGGNFSNGSCNTPNLWLGDINGDNALDVISLSRYYNLATGDGKGNFTPRTLAMPYQYQGVTVAVEDIDNNGLKDMIAIKSNFGNQQFLISIAQDYSNDNFTNVKNFILTNMLGGSSDSIAKVADVNKDGYKDILYFPELTGFFQILATAPGVFDKEPTWIETNSWINSVVTADLNNDGNVDIVASTSDGLMLLFGDKKGGWLPPKFPLGKMNTNAAGVVVKDINRDGRDDIVFGAGAKVYVLLQKP